jgi:cyclohexanecarboxylate-CoA ligase
VLLMPSPLAHQTGFMLAMLPSLHIGATLVLQDIWDPAKAVRIIREEGVTFSMGATPFLGDLTAQAEQQPEAFRTLRIFGSAGAPIPRALVRRATDAMGATILSCWGMSENGGVTLTRPEDPPEKAFESDGSPLPGVRLRVVDGDRRALPPNTEGRLEVSACSQSPGYLKRPNLPGLDAEGWFDTGDMARIDPDGYVRITGRAKDIIIRGGENIPVVEIENLLYRHPDVQEVSIVAMPDPRLGERACAFVVPKPGAQPALASLCDFLTEQGTAKTYLPERLEVVEALPRTPTGKVQKFRLREAAASLAPDRD